jgi:hypothetical protein
VWHAACREGKTRRWPHVASSTDRKALPADAERLVRQAETSKVLR